MTFDSMHPVIGRCDASPLPRPSALYCASSCLLRPFTLRCTGKRGVAKGEGAQQTEKGVADQSRVNGVTTCETPSRHAGRPVGRERRARSSSAAGPATGTTGGAGAPEPARRTAPEGPAALIRVRRRGTPARWCAWGSWDDSGRAVVQICCKGAPGRDRPREEARNTNDPPHAPRLDPGLCDRFGQTAPPRAPERATTTGAPTTSRAPRERRPSPRGRAPAALRPPRRRRWRRDRPRPRGPGRP